MSQPPVASKNQLLQTGGPPVAATAPYRTIVKLSDLGCDREPSALAATVSL